MIKIIVVCMCFNAFAFSQSSEWTLQEAETQAVQHNLSILAQHFEINLADADSITARLIPNNPALSLNADVTPEAGSIAPERKNYFAWLTFPVELGGKRSNRIAVADAEKAGAAYDFDDAVRHLLLQVRTEFYDVLNAKAALALAVDNENSLDSIVSLNTIRLKASDISESELMRSRILAEQQRLEVGEARIGYTTAARTLQLDLGLSPTGDQFEVGGDIERLPDTLTQTLAELEEVALGRRSDLLALRSRLDQAVAQEHLEESNGIIDLSVGGYYSQQLGQSFTGVTLSAPIPLFNRNQGNREKSAALVEQIRLQVADLERRTTSDVETAYYEYEMRRQIVARMQTNVVSLSRSVRETVAYAYRRGGTSILDFLDAQRTFNDTMKSYYDALTALHKSSFALRAAAGI